MRSILEFTSRDGVGDPGAILGERLLPDIPDVGG